LFSCTNLFKKIGESLSQYDKLKFEFWLRDVYIFGGTDKCQEKVNCNGS